MGTFMGHVLPGSFFIFFAVFEIVEILHRYYRAKYNKGQPYKNKCAHTSSFLCERAQSWQVQGYMKMFFCTVGILGEVITGMRDGRFVAIGNGQHATMFFFFGVSGLIDVLLHHKVLVPKMTDYFFTLFCFGIEGLLFTFHLHGRDELDVQIHKLLVYTIYFNVITIIIEMYYQENVIAGLARNLFVMLQGTWFWQVAFILYNPNPNAEKWNPESHEQMMLTTIIFAWHIMFIFAFIFVQAMIFNCIHKRGTTVRSYDSELSMQSLMSKNGHTALSMNDESDLSDLEFEKPVTKE